ncbi:extensin-like [Gouania willdenowi]|uniref:extensin-like n=1 Tax=Gouania willdenowi TaxID=441366 RepID=UPI001056DE2F|nr:extensin-like [Gouania willdenowi]
MTEAFRINDVERGTIKMTAAITELNTVDPETFKTLKYDPATETLQSFAKRRCPGPKGAAKLAETTRSKEPQSTRPSTELPPPRPPRDPRLRGSHRPHTCPSTQPPRRGPSEPPARDPSKGAEVHAQETAIIAPDRGPSQNFIPMKGPRPHASKDPRQDPASKLSLPNPKGTAPAPGTPECEPPGQQPRPRRPPDSTSHDSTSPTGPQPTEWPPPQGTHLVWCNSPQGCPDPPISLQTARRTHQVIDRAPNHQNSKRHPTANSIIPKGKATPVQTPATHHRAQPPHTTGTAQKTTRMTRPAPSQGERHPTPRKADKTRRDPSKRATSNTPKDPPPNTPDRTTPLRNLMCASQKT